MLVVKKYIHSAIFFGIIGTIFLFGRLSFANNNAPEKLLPVGDAVLFENPVPEYFYSVFLPEGYPTFQEVCATMTGQELVADTNLKHYGTCFINDPGVFTILGTDEFISASYADIVASGHVVYTERIQLEHPSRYAEIMKDRMDALVKPQEEVTPQASEVPPEGVIAADVPDTSLEEVIVITPIDTAIIAPLPPVNNEITTIEF